VLLGRLPAQGKLTVSVGAPLRAPTADGEVLAEPPLAAVGSLIGVNRARLARPNTEVLGRPWDELRLAARRSAISAAQHYLRAHDEPVPEATHEHLILAGHQPELFHPGVWIKHFALHGLARRHKLTAINLVVDNDTLKSTALRLPHPATTTNAWPYAVNIPFDRWSGETPYEERTILEKPLFEQFPEEAATVLRPWPLEPMLVEFWQDVLLAAERTPLLGTCFVVARRSFERRWGCHNLELPVSLLCQTEPFAWFACHVLSDLPRFHGIYNDCVHAYRKSHGIRSRNHPVPDLARDGDFLETPFWGWRAGKGRRNRLFARLTPGCVELRAGTEPWPALPSPVANPRAAIGAWQGLEKDGYKIRTRALSNTLYARLFLGDLFIHGIGGGKYDELTDAILLQFYGCEPPGFLVLTATRLLPLPSLPSSPDDRRHWIRQARDLHYGPERFILPPPGSPLEEVLREKQRWLGKSPRNASERRERFEMIRQLTATLRVPLEGEEKRLRDALSRCEHEIAANKVLHRRDYAFCLYPESSLRPFLTQML
jgi:hypothetical protein